MTKALIGKTLMASINAQKVAGGVVEHITVSQFQAMYGGVTPSASAISPPASALPGGPPTNATPNPSSSHPSPDAVNIESNIAVTAKEMKSANAKSERQMKIDAARAIKKEASDDKMLREFEGLNDSIQSITDIATGRRQQKTIGTKISGIGDNIKNLFTMRGFLDKMGVVKKGTGGVFDNMLQNREEKKDYVATRIKLEKSAAQAAGESIQKFNKKYEREVSASFDRQQKIQNAIIKNEEYIQKMKRQGFTDEQISLSKEIKLRATLAGKLQKEDSRLGTPENPEARDEQIAAVEEQTKLMKQIEKNTGEKDKTGKKQIEKVVEKTGAFDIATGILGAAGLIGVLTALKKTILGALTSVFSRASLGLLLRGLLLKIALPLSILNGIMDGVKAAVDGAEWKDIISSGLAGLFSGLTFGLVDPEWFKKTFTDDVGVWFENNVIKAMGDIIDNVKEFFTSMIDFVGLVFKAAFPDATAFINKHLGLSIGEKNPTDLTPANKGNIESTEEQRKKQMNNRNTFSTQEELAKASAIKPTSAAMVSSKSAENAGAAQSGGSSNVVVAPTTTVNNSKNEATVYRHTPRNPESTFNRHIDSRYSPA